ncbi:LysR family transcriptional regulator [Cognatishimia sp. SS12]|uniref:LysR family transcriptional regulator n=1 Tax=Cognatishimia sp. SS12 TaxID=2979465 RepID=UPI0023304525|nr:LysR family transcriptional regulator [Cognatishimia sp. SS12]MDC0738925.1 LysR family transcriptional regulator [Cognatishimia sp. SS12]
MNLNHLSLFLKVVERGNISAAAKELDMNQPALSRFISRLEDELGAPLFERHPRGVEPNAFGKILLHYAQSIDANLRSALRHIETSGQDEIQIGAGYVWLHGPLSKALVKLHAQFPNTNISVIAGMPYHLHGQLARGELDMVLGPTTLADVYSETLTPKRLMQLDLAVLVRRGHPWDDGRICQTADLAELRWVLPEGTLIRNHFNQMFDAHGIVAPKPHVSVNDFSCALQIVAQSDLAIMASTADFQSNLTEKLASISCPEIEMLRYSGVTLRKNETPHPVCAALLEELQQIIADPASPWAPPETPN